MFSTGSQAQTAVGGGDTGIYIPSHLDLRWVRTVSQGPFDFRKRVVHFLLFVATPADMGDLGGRGDDSALEPRWLF